METTNVVVQCPLAGCLVPDEVCLACEYRTTGFRCPDSKRTVPIAVCERCLAGGPKTCVMQHVADGKLSLAALHDTTPMCGCPRILTVGSVSADVGGVVALFRKEPEHGKL